MALTVSTDDLATFLGDADIDVDRAALLLQYAVDMCKTIVNPLPDGAGAVVMSVAARAYANPQGVSLEQVGPYSVTRAFPGIYLTKSEKQTLKRMAGRGGAFTVDPTPVDAGVVDPLAPWDYQVTEEFLEDAGGI